MSKIVFKKKVSKNGDLLLFFIDTFFIKITKSSSKIAILVLQPPKF